MPINNDVNKKTYPSDDVITMWDVSTLLESSSANAEIE